MGLTNPQSNILPHFDFTWPLIFTLTLTCYALTAHPSGVISPCKVHSMVLQPHFGISAKTKKLVSIVQVPPILIQTVQIGICHSENKDFSSISHSLENVPHFICRQRYEAIEVYLKPEHNSTKRIEEPPVKVQDQQEMTILKPPRFKKDFVIIEAGCDFFFNFFPAFKLPQDKESKKRPLEASSNSSSTHIGISRLVGVSSPLERSSAGGKGHFHSKSDHSTQTNKEESSESGSGRIMKANFFRKAFHVPSSATTQREKLNNEEKVADQSHLQNEFNSGNEKDGQKDENPEIVSSIEKMNDGESEIVSTSKEVNCEGEMVLAPEDIGLPILILDPTFDPVMKIFQKYEMS